VTFGGKKLYRLGFMLTNMVFAKGLHLLVHLREFCNQRLVCVISVRLVRCFHRHLFKKGMSGSSDTVSLSSSNSESMESGRGVGRLVEEGSISLMVVVVRIPMERVTEVREDPPEEIAESNWLAKADYEWVAADVRNQSSLFQWSRLLNSWLICTLVIAKGVDRDIVSLERVSAIERVCHGQEGATEKFFYMYLCHFSQLHVRLPLDDFTMGYSVSSTWHLPSYIRTVGRSCRPSVFCASHCIYGLLLMRFFIFMTQGPGNRLLGYPW